MGRNKKYTEELIRVTVALPKSLWKKLYGARLSKHYGEKKMPDVIIEAINEWFAKRDGDQTGPDGDQTGPDGEQTGPDGE